MSGSYFSNLAGVRGLAAAVVLLAHVVQLHFLRFVGLGTPLHHISSVASEYAVVVFFILSGYLIAHTLEENVKRNRRLRLDVFVAARIARLYPPLLFAICISLVVFSGMEVFGLPGRENPMVFAGDLYSAREFIYLSPSEIGWALLMVRGMLEINGPLWSLYIEAKMYVLYAIVIAILAGHRTLFQNSILGIAFGIVAATGFKYSPEFLMYAAVWLVGALAYYFENGLDKWRGRFLTCLSLIATLVFIDGWIAWLGGERVWSTARDVFVALGIAWLLFKYSGRMSVGGKLGNFSYSLYVTHFPILLLFQSILVSVGAPSLAAAILTSVVSILIAAAVAFAGGKLESRKAMFQNWLLDHASRFSAMGRKTS